MSKNKRPMCITVIGWFWIIIGVVIFLGSVMMLFSFFVVRIDQINQSILIPLVLIPISILSIASGISFLKLKPWTRKILEILSWLAIILSFGDGIFGVVHLSSYKPLLWDGLFCIPFAIIIKYLRGNTVKNSFEFIAEPVAKPIATPDYLLNQERMIKKILKHNRNTLILTYITIILNSLFPIYIFIYPAFLACYIAVRLEFK